MKISKKIKGKGSPQKNKWFINREKVSVVYDNKTRLFLETFFNFTGFYGFIIPLTTNNTSYFEILSTKFLTAKSSIDKKILTIPNVDGSVKYVNDEKVLSLTISLTLTYLNSSTSYRSFIEYSIGSGFMNRYFVNYENSTNNEHCHFKLDLLNINMLQLPFDLSFEGMLSFLSLTIISITLIRRKISKS